MAEEILKPGIVSIPKVDILGVHVAAVNMPWLIDFTMGNLEALAGEYYCVANVHTVVMASEDESYRSIQNNAVLAMPDGGPLSALGRRRGFAGMERTTGPDFMREILQKTQTLPCRHYFYGSTEETLSKMRARLRHDFPDMQIAGMYSPPFREQTEAEDRETVLRINETQPDFLWVGLGAPKQERWMAAHRGKVRGLMVGVGAAFDYLAGNISRAPEWMQRNNLEWLYRLIQDPGRLFMRYFVTNRKFIWRAVILGEQEHERRNKGTGPDCP